MAKNRAKIRVLCTTCGWAGQRIAAHPFRRPCPACRTAKLLVPRPNPEANRELEAIVRDSVEFLRLTSSDISALGKRVDAEPGDQVSRRALVRALWACIEGTINTNFAFALEMVERGHQKLTTAEVSILKEEQYSLSNGKARSRDVHAPVLDRLRFAFRMRSKVFHVKYRELPFKGDGWEAIKSSKGIRDRITHPRNQAEFDISDEDLRITLLASKEFVEGLQRFERELGQELSKKLSITVPHQ